MLSSTFFGAKATVYPIASFFFPSGYIHLEQDGYRNTFLPTATRKPKVIMVLRIVNLNVGYHNEHHDFLLCPGITYPVRKIAGNYYNTLGYHILCGVVVPVFSLTKHILHTRAWRGIKAKQPPLQSRLHNTCFNSILKSAYWRFMYIEGIDNYNNYFFFLFNAARLFIFLSL